MRVAAGDTVRWDASGTHPLVLDDEPGGPYTTGPVERVLTTSGRYRFHCYVHGPHGMTGVMTVGDATPPAIARTARHRGAGGGEPVAFRAVASDPGAARAADRLGHGR